MTKCSAKVVSHKAAREKEINDKLTRNLTTACFLVEADAKRNAPVDTGRLRSSIAHRLEKLKNVLRGIVGTRVEYASYQEFGTSKMAAHPFLFPALEANKKRIKELLKR